MVESLISFNQLKALSSTRITMLFNKIFSLFTVDVEAYICYCLKFHLKFVFDYENKERVIKKITKISITFPVIVG